MSVAGTANPAGHVDSNAYPTDSRVRQKAQEKSLLEANPGKELSELKRRIKFSSENHKDGTSRGT